MDHYRSLLKNNADEYQSTRQANFIAALATWKLTDSSNQIQLANEDLSDETYDTMYNSACVLLSSAQYAEAEAKLRKAEGEKENFLIDCLKFLFSSMSTGIGRRRRYD